MYGNSVQFFFFYFSSLHNKSNSWICALYKNATCSHLHSFSIPLSFWNLTPLLSAKNDKIKIEMKTAIFSHKKIFIQVLNLSV